MTKEYLKRYREAYLRLKDIALELKSNSDLEAKPIGSMRGGSISTLDGRVIRKEFLEEEYSKQLKALIGIRRKITVALDGIHPECARILYLRYISMMDYKEIAAHTNYSESHVFRLHQKGLKELESK